MDTPYFTHLNIYDNFYFKNHPFCGYVFDTAYVTLSSIETKITDTEQNCSYEGQYLSGKELIVLGNLQLSILFKCKNDVHSGYWYRIPFPFSTYIIIPNDVCPDDPQIVSHTIEDITTRWILPSSLFISVTLLLAYQDTYL